MSTLCPVFDKTGNRQLINTGCKIFDRQTSALSQGNVYGSTITGSFIRHKGETQCNGFTSPEGHLRAYDLKHFPRISPLVRAAVEKYTDTKAAIVYRLFHNETTHGYILASYTDDLVQMWATSSTQVVLACLPHLCNVETMEIETLEKAMKFSTEQTPLPPVGSVFRRRSEWGCNEICVDSLVGPRAEIMHKAGYAFGRKVWHWSDGGTSEATYFFPASLFKNPSYVLVLD